MSEGERGCDCGGAAAFSDDLIYCMPVWFSGGHFLLPEYGVSTFIVVQYLKDFLVSEGTAMIDHAKLEPVLSGYQTYFRSTGFMEKISNGKLRNISTTIGILMRQILVKCSRKPLQRSFRFWIPAMPILAR